LSLEDAVEIALLRSAAVQGALADLGIAEADVDQAGRPANPTLKLARLVSGVEVELERQLLVNVLSFLTLRDRIALAEASAQRTRFLVALEISTIADRVRRTWIEAVAAREGLGIVESIFEKTKIAAELAQRMAQVGNTSSLDQSRVQTVKAETAAALARARLAAQVSRERLVRAMGLWGVEARVDLPRRLPDLPNRAGGSEDVERMAVLKRLDLAAARIEIDVMAAQLGLTERTSRISLLELSGIKVDVEEKGEESKAFTLTGFELEVSIPIFDQGEAKVDKAKWTYLQAVERLRAMAVSARSEVREASLTYRGIPDIARHLQRDVTPLRQKIAEEELLRYNGMLVGTFELINASRQASEATLLAIDAKRDALLAKEQLAFAMLVGKAEAPASGGGSTVVAEAEEGGH
jgi:outer membrane protein TolC